MGEYIFKNPKTNIKANLVGHFLGREDISEDNFYIENTRNGSFTIIIPGLR